MAQIVGTIKSEKISKNDVVTGEFPGPATDEDDDIQGGLGNDTIESAGGNDIISGDLAEFISQTGGRDIIRGGDGDDSIFGDAVTFGVLETPEAAKKPKAPVGGADLIEGGTGNDQLVGDALTALRGSRGGADRLFGEDGNDQLIGDFVVSEDGAIGGKDILDGGAGEDLLEGGGGADSMTGGADADSFVLGAGSGKDRILDFVDGTDTLNIEIATAADANTLFDVATLDSDADGKLTAADDFVAGKRNTLVIDYGAAAGYKANVDTVTLVGVTEISTTSVV